MSAQVLIYTTPSCPYCQAAKRFLRERGVPYRDIDVSRDQRAAMEMVRKSGQMGVPVLDIGGRIVIGFDRSKINALLGMH
ncbi:MAG: glutaredoxin family protein [Limnochordaceae bacterium]|nr:glutaredoxin family protein [Limnochordaceae bacterium]